MVPSPAVVAWRTPIIFSTSSLIQRLTSKLGRMRFAWGCGMVAGILRSQTFSPTMGLCEVWMECGGGEGQ